MFETSWEKNSYLGKISKCHRISVNRIRKTLKLLFRWQECVVMSHEMWSEKLQRYEKNYK